MRRNQTEIPAAMLVAVGAAALVVLLVATGGAKGETEPGFKSPCGTAEQVADRVGGCLVPINNMVKGKIAYPNDDAGIVIPCSQMSSCEKCIRATVKDCLQGIHRSAVGGLGTATKRFRVNECKSPESRAKYIGPLQCIIKSGERMTNIMKNHTAIAQGIRDLKIPAEDRLLAMCCLFESLDRDIEAKFGTVCPQHLPVILSMIHSITDDTRAVLCSRPKCNGVITKNLLRSTYTPPYNIEGPVMEVLFAI